jgi:hypothetical protein
METLSQLPESVMPVDKAKGLPKRKSPDAGWKKREINNLKITV